MANKLIQLVPHIRKNKLIDLKERLQDCEKNQEKLKNEDKLMPTERSLNNIANFLIHCRVDKDTFEIIVGDTTKCDWDILLKT